MEELHHQTHQNTPKVAFNEKHVLAMQLKFEGTSYKKISEQINVPIDTLKDWFRRYGLLHDEYLRFAQEHVLGLYNELSTRLQIHTERAMNVVSEAMEDDTPLPIRLKAAQYVLDKVIPPIMERQAEREAKKQDLNKIIQELGLTDKDFEEDKYVQTIRKVSDYLIKNNY